MEALLVPLVIFELSTSVLLALAIRNEFFSKKDLPYLPYFVGILAFGRGRFKPQYETSIWRLIDRHNINSSRDKLDDA